MGTFDPFVDYIISNQHTFHNNMLYYISNNATFAIVNKLQIDLAQLSIISLGYANISTIADDIVPDFCTGWDGDLATTMKDITTNKFVLLQAANLN